MKYFHFILYLGATFIIMENVKVTKGEICSFYAMSISVQHFML